MTDLASSTDPFDAAAYFGIDGQAELHESPEEAIMRLADDFVCVADENPAALRAWVDEVAPIRVLAYQPRNKQAIDHTLDLMAESCVEIWWDELEHDEAAAQSGRSQINATEFVRSLLWPFAAHMGTPTMCDQVASRVFGSEELYTMLLAHLGLEEAK